MLGEVSISEGEFQARIGVIKKFMHSNGLGALVVFSASHFHIWYQTGHVSYLSNWADRDRICDSMVVVFEKGNCVMLLSGLPYMTRRAAEVSWIRDIRSVGSADPQAAAAPGLRTGFGTEVRKVLRERGLEGKKVGVAGLENMPVPVYQTLIEALSETAIEFPDDIVAEMRNRKSSAEIDIMRHAGKLSDLGYQTLLKTAKPGMWGYEVIAAMEHAVRAQGVDYVQYWMCSGPATGWPVSIPDMKPHRRKLNKSDQITCCSYVVYQGYWAHSMRTGTLGGPSKQQKQIFPPCADVNAKAIEMLKPGVSISEVVKATRLTAEAHDMKLHCPRIGHGIGLDYGEKPSLTEQNHQKLEPGNVVAIHVQFDLPGTNNFYVPLGDICHVTKEGVEILTNFPREPFCA